MARIDNTADQTLRRHRPDADETLRRQRDGDKTLRRTGGTAEHDAAADSALLGQAFPVQTHDGSVRLQVVRRLGHGGEGELYICRDDTATYIAKILQRDSDVEVLEAMASQQDTLQKHHLVPCIYVGNMADVPGSALDQRTYVIHPYYEGGDLAALHNVRRINPSIRYNGDETQFRPCAECYVDVSCDYAQVDEDAFRALVSQTATALRALHKVSFASGTAGAVHRDIKPQNILVDEDGSYALGDFGLISAMSTGSPLKFTQRIGLSHGYSPPEAYSDRAFKQTVTRKYDYFSLGMTLLHAVGGRPRYIIDDGLAAKTPAAMTLADFYETIMLSAVSVPEQLPARIRNLIRGLLAADPDDRWGETEVFAWLNNENPLVPTADKDVQDAVSLRAFGKTERGARNVASTLVSHWDTFSRMLADGKLRIDWDGTPDPAYQREVEHAIAAAPFAAGPDAALQTLVLSVYRKTGHVFRGKRFDTDEALGCAMTAAAAQPQGADFAIFADMLRQGGISNTWILTGGARNDGVLRAVVRLEESAEKSPGAAMFAAGAMLSGQPVPEAEVPLSGGPLRIRNAQQMQQWVMKELAEAANRSKSPPVPKELGHIPGRSAADRDTPFLRQVDGSVLAGGTAPLAPVALSGDMLTLLRILMDPPEVPDALDAHNRLFAMLCLNGDIPSVTVEEPEHGSAADGFLPRHFTGALSLFSSVRSGHVMDDTLSDLLRAITDRLQYVSSLRVPGVHQSTAQRADSEVRAVNNAADAFGRSRAFVDFVSAAHQANASRAVLADLQPLNYEAAERVLQLAPGVMSSNDPKLHEMFDAVLEQYAKSGGDKKDLVKLLEQLDAFEKKAAVRRRSDLSAYLLSDTMLFVRNYNRTAARPLDIELPDTTDAREYYRALSEQVDRSRRKLVPTGLVDEDGRVLQ